MPRIFKGSEETLKLYVRNCESLPSDLQVVLYTTNINVAATVTDISISGSTLYATVQRDTLGKLSDGVINYVILGYDEEGNEVYNTERQSNYYLKTPDNLINIVNQALKSVEYTENGEYMVTPDGLYDGMEKVEVTVGIDTDSYYESGYTEGYDKGNTDGYADGYEIGNTEGYTSGKTDGIAEGYADGYEIGNEEGYANGKTDGLEEGYADGYEIGNTEGYTSGKTDGIAEGYADGYEIGNTEGYTSGKTDGYNEGYEVGYGVSYDEGYNKGQEDIAANARVLDVTENGTYMSKFSDTIFPTLITGVYDDGTEFYNYTQLTNQAYNTNITVTQDSVIELWYKGDNEKTNDGWNTIFGCLDGDDTNFYLGYLGSSNTNLRGFLGEKKIEFSWADDGWHHIIMKNDGLWIDDVLIGSFNSTKTFASILDINGSWDKFVRNANGCFGMIKIDDVVIIPTADGFLNTSTNELLEIVKEGDYVYTENLPIYGEGELYKTINVNVIPKISVRDYGLKFAYSTFKEVPEWADFEGVTDMSNMFNGCPIITVPLFDTSNVTDMSNMFRNCGSLQTLPLFDTSNVTTMQSLFEESNSLQTLPLFDTSNVTNMNRMFYNVWGNENLVSLPRFDCSKVTDMGWHFSYRNDGMSNLTDVGGWENLSCNWNDNYGLYTCPNLTYQSCINVLNGLYDFVGNGSTETRTLKVHSNFLTTVGDDISIGTEKGWSIIS